MPTSVEEQFTELIQNKKKFVESLLVIEDKNRNRVPFKLNPIQNMAFEQETGRDIWLKPAQVGFSSWMLAEKQIDTLCTPGTNTVLIAYDEFITGRLLNKADFNYNHLASLGIPGFPETDHSCLPYHAKVQLADGTFRQISQIVNKREPVKVLACNLENGRVETKRVVNWFKYPSNHMWINLGSGYKFSHMMTLNHPIYTGDGWKLANNVELGDTTWHNGFIPNDDQKQLIVGSVLGDAGQSQDDKGIKFGQSVKEYAEFKYQILKDESSGFHESVSVGGFSAGENKFYTFNLHNCPYFESWGIGDIDVRGLAIWFCDDGCMYEPEIGTKTVYISTYCFSYDTQLRMREVLWNKLGIRSEVRPTHGGRYFKLKITNPLGSDNHDRFFSLITPYVPTCMEYKLPRKFRGKSKYVWDGKFGYGLVPYEIKVKDMAITGDRIYNYVYNIEVEDDHNYFTSIGLCKNSTYEKTYKFYRKGILVSTSSMYIASANSKVAGRAETIHHLLCDEFAFWDPKAVTNIFTPALDRVPPDGTIDIYGTPNGEANDFHDMYLSAKQQLPYGTNVFTPHFFGWYMHPEYQILPDDIRCDRMPMLRDPMKLTNDEENLIIKLHLTLNQIRWRRWKIAEKNSIRKTGEMSLMFKQEFPEDDESCFLSAGDMYYDPDTVNMLAEKCFDAPHHIENLNVWKLPEEVKGMQVAISCDPSQAKVSQTAITIWAWDSVGKPIHCATDAGWYPPDITVRKMQRASQLYNGAMMVWEANSHGLAISEGLKFSRPIYYREDIISGKTQMVPGWLTGSGNKNYMWTTMAKNLIDMEVHDIDFVSQLRNIRVVGDKVVAVGPDDIHDSGCIALVTHNTNPIKRGMLTYMSGGRYR